LNREQVRYALERYFTATEGKLTQRQIAHEFRVSRETISRIVRGECWRDVYAQFMREKDGGTVVR